MIQESENCVLIHVHVHVGHMIHEWAGDNGLYTCICRSGLEWAGDNTGGVGWGQYRWSGLGTIPEEWAGDNTSGTGWGQCYSGVVILKALVKW